MATIKEITVSLGRTVQLAPYEPLNYHLSYNIELVEGDDEKKEILKAREMLEKQINEYIALQKGETYEEINAEEVEGVLSDMH